MLICNKKSRLKSDAPQNAQRLFKACSFCPSIRQVFVDDVTKEKDSEGSVFIWEGAFIKNDTVNNERPEYEVDRIKHDNAVMYIGRLTIVLI